LNWNRNEGEICRPWWQTYPACNADGSARGCFSAITPTTANANRARNAETLGFTPAEKESIHDHLYRYTHGLTAAEKITFHQNVISRRPMNGHRAIDEKEALDAVSPIGRLARSSARVVVIHDANDFVVPVTHIRALERELAQRTPPNHRLLITPALSHVTLQPRFVLDILRMIDHIGELYA
jgi:pimeloyl-ACP methyl ester carboxylesterase